MIRVFWQKKVFAPKSVLQNPLSLVCGKSEYGDTDNKLGKIQLTWTCKQKTCGKISTSFESNPPKPKPWIPQRHGLNEVGLEQIHRFLRRFCYKKVRLAPLNEWLRYSINRTKHRSLVNIRKFAIFRNQCTRILVNFWWQSNEKDEVKCCSYWHPFLDLPKRFSYQANVQSARWTFCTSILRDSLAVNLDLTY